MTPSEKCYILCRHYESCRLKAYQDSGGVWTIGWGATHYQDGSPVKEGDTITQEQADALHVHDVRRFSGYLDRSMDVNRLTQDQYDAMTDFCYNRGPGNMRKSRIFKLVKVNPLDPAIPEAFLDHENIIDNRGTELRGLIYRRRSEAGLYTSGIVKFYN